MEEIYTKTKAKANLLTRATESNLNMQNKYILSDEELNQQIHNIIKETALEACGKKDK